MPSERAAGGGGGAAAAGCGMLGAHRLDGPNRRANTLPRILLVLSPCPPCPCLAACAWHAPPCHGDRPPPNPSPRPLQAANLPVRHALFRHQDLPGRDQPGGAPHHPLPGAQAAPGEAHGAPGHQGAAPPPQASLSGKPAPAERTAWGKPARAERTAWGKRLVHTAPEALTSAAQQRGCPCQVACVVPSNGVGAQPALRLRPACRRPCAGAGG